jgi:LemA protein
MRDLTEELSSTENRVGFARQAYNDTVLEYNNAAGQFPANLLAGVFGFRSADMLQSTVSEAERLAPRVLF